MSSPASVGFPKELSNEISYTIPESVSSFAVKIAPSNGATFSSATTALVAASTLNLNGSNAPIIFDVPCGQKSQFVDVRQSVINFRVAYQITGAPTACVLTNFQLRSSAAAFFDNMRITSQSGVILEEINSYGLINDLLIQTEIGNYERDSLAALYGFSFEETTAPDYNYNQGHAITGLNGATLTANKTVYFSYSIPLRSALLGVDASKFFQLATNKLQVQLNTSSILPLSIVTGATTAASLTVSLDNVSLNLQLVDIGAEGLKMLNKTGTQFYNGISYKISSAILPAGTSGAVTLLAGLRASSMRSIFVRATEASVVSGAGCINYIYDSKMPLATSASWNIGGKQYPSNPTDFVHNPSLVLLQTQSAAGKFGNSEYKCGLIPSQYFRMLPYGGALPDDIDARLVSTLSQVVSQDQFCWGYCLERISKAGIMDGMNTTAGNSFLNLVLSNSNTNTVTVFFIGKMDVLFVHDTATGEIQSRM